MSQPLPHGNFKWSEERDIDELIYQYGRNDESTEGCIVMVDLEYPKELHDLHNDYPVAPETMKVTNEMLSEYAEDLKEKCNIGDDVCKKLVPNLMNKERYVVDIRNLK